jgi:hypothetical protein
MLLIAGGKISQIQTHMSHLLRELHISRPRPITDPQPDLKLLSRPRQHQADQQQGPRYLPGNLWVPDTYSLGPAPAALAGAVCMSMCINIQPDVSDCQTEE